MSATVARIIPAVSFAGPGQRGRAATPLPLRWPNHYPGLALDYGLDCTAILADTADTIAAVSVAIDGAGLVADSSGPAANAAGVAAKVALVRLRGGVAGTDYRVTVGITTAQGLPVSFVVALYAGIAVPGSAPVPQMPIMVGPPADAPLLGSAAGKFVTVTLGAGLMLQDGVLSVTGQGGTGAVSSVAGRTGDVTLAAADIASGIFTPDRLPLATTLAPGAVIVGTNLTLADGTISLTKADAIAALGLTPVDAAGAAAAAPVQSVAGRTGAVALAAADVSGLAKVATSGAYADLSGTPAPFTLPAATGATLGGVIVGSNLTVSSGTISLTKENALAALGLTPVDAAGAAAAAPVQSVAGRAGAVAVDYGVTVDFSQGAMPQPGTITLDGALAAATTITDVVHKVGTAGGQIDFAVQIVAGGVAASITGLDAVSSTGSSYATSKATAANKAAADTALQLVISKVTGTPAGASITIRGTRP